MQLNYFYNAGFGWVCRHCESEIGETAPRDERHSRAFREGESESKVPELAVRSRARWLDKEQRFLICPRCGITEDTFIN